MEEGTFEDLDSLIQASRTPRGRSFLASKGLVPSFLRRLSSTPSHLVVTYLRLLRNLCAGDITNQNSFIQANGVDVIASFILTSGSPTVTIPAEVVRVGLQILGNVAAAGEEHRCAVWARFFRDGFLELAETRDSGVCDPLCMIMHSCCFSSENGEGSRRRIGELSGDGLGLPIVVKIIRTACSVDYRGDWLHLFISRLCFDGTCFPQLFSNLSDVIEEPKDVGIRKFHFSMEQAFLLDMLAEILSELPFKFKISNKFALGVFQVLKDASNIVNLTSRCISPLPTGIPQVDVLGFSLNILKDICALDDSSKGTRNELIDMLLSMGLCQLLLCLLKDLEPPSTVRKSYAYDAGQELPSSVNRTGKTCPYKGFRRDIVAVIGNCMFGRKQVQDEIRRLDGILLLLQQCVTDEENPFLREWGIWTLRSLLEGNLDNQQVVSELELQGSVDTPEISGLGMRVEVDPKSHQAKLVNLS